MQVDIDLAGAPACGLAWLEAELGGFMSPSVPVVLSDDADVVDEIRKLEDVWADGRWVPRVP